MSNINNNQADDAATHPSVYRDTVNQTVSPKVTGCNVTAQGQKTENKCEDDWDLYPNMIRKVENEGTAKQVEHLHELEHTTSR